MNIPSTNQNENHHIPIGFYNKICPLCGKESLDYYDIYGRISKQEVHPYSKIVCRNCGKKLTFNWEIVNGVAKPCTGQYSAKDEFNNFIK